MLKMSDEFNEYIAQVSMDFSKYTHNLVGLSLAEESRKKNIRLELMLLLKLYKGMELTDREKEILNKHLFQFDYKTDLNRCICQIVYEVSDRTYSKVDKIKNDNALLFDRNIMAIYREYLNVLKQYMNSLLHAICFNHQIILKNPINNQEICPVIDFDSEILIEKKKIFVKKKTFN